MLGMFLLEFLYFKKLIFQKDIGIKAKAVQLAVILLGTKKGYAIERTDVKKPIRTNIIEFNKVPGR